MTIGVLGDNEDTQSEQNLPRGPRGQVSHNDPVVGSSIAAIRNSEEKNMRLLRSLDSTWRESQSLGSRCRCKHLPTPPVVFASHLGLIRYRVSQKNTLSREQIHEIF